MLTTKEILGKDIYELNRKHYDMLKKEVTDENVTWILGAGISAPAGLPNWTTLLAKMWARLSELENEMPLNHEVEEGESSRAQNTGRCRRQKVIQHIIQ